MEAEVKQVGGRHYEADYQHWDWALETGLGYLEGSATKYVSRWRSKGGVQDLKKALSFVRKLRAHADTVEPAGNRRRWDPVKLDRYIKAANLGQLEAIFTKQMDHWINVTGLDAAELTLEELIDEAMREHC